MQQPTNEKNAAPAYEAQAPAHPASVPAGAPGMSAGFAPSAYGQQPQMQQVQQGQPREWSTGLCSCGDNCGEFCLSWWCPCMGYSRYKSRLEALQQTGAPLPADDVPNCAAPGVLYLAVHCLSGFGFIFDFMARTDIRKRYNIDGSAFGDCCTACCCIPCVQGQNSRELRREEDAFRARMQAGQYGQGPGPDQTMQMQAQKPMAYPPASA
ncbi:hypothetical protein BMF94_2044 [Rhodotorula taiwanensis]|uniref:PLAC8 family-domain-containing protein n=1 Tax=Rhodotorula taiwanensis TaxID=741276 RepID=A0A2S5BE74_9BASI|nr:hypothetical protein BMF94_2044 [Rhodotorula taiwanensis]